MQKYIAVAGVVLLFSCSKKTESTEKPTVQKETVYVEKPAEQTVQPEEFPEEEAEEPAAAPEPVSENLPDLSGLHSLTLQWISWDHPGTVKFVPLGKNKYKVSGRQKIGKQYLTIEGEISQVSEKELRFDGTIKHSTIANANGKECVKKGPQIFYSTQNRKYWRMQEMLNCDGVGTDYIDIYY